MITIFFSIISFLILIWLHHYLYNRLRPLITLKSTLFIFTVAILSHTTLQFLISRLAPELLSLPLTSSFIFALLVCVYFIFLTSVFLNDDPPAAKIYLLMSKYKRLSLTKITHFFADHTLIQKRVNDLLNQKLIYKQHNLYIITPKGQTLYKILLVYRRLLGWNDE